jgi:integrase
VKRCYPRLEASRFAGTQLKRVRRELLERKCRFSGDPLSRTYINQLVQAAVQCWKWLLSEGLVAAGCVASLQAVVQLHHGQGGRDPARVLPPAPGWDRVLHFLTPTIRAMVLVQVSGGMRPQDVCRMRRSDLSTRPGERVEFPGTGRFIEATVIDGIPVWVYVPRDHKTAHLGKPRAIPLGPKAQAILAPLIAGLRPDEPVSK